MSGIIVKIDSFFRTVHQHNDIHVTGNTLLHFKKIGNGICLKIIIGTHVDHDGPFLLFHRNSRHCRLR